MLDQQPDVKLATKTFSITIPADLHAELVRCRKLTGRFQNHLIEQGIRLVVQELAHDPDRANIPGTSTALAASLLSALPGIAPGPTPANVAVVAPGPVCGPSSATVGGILPRPEPNSKPNAKPSPSADPSSDLPLAQALSAIKARKEGPQVWFELQPVLTAYRVKREDLVPECNPAEDIPTFDGIEHIDTVCRRLIDGLSTVGYETKNQINDHMNAISAQLLL